ncbi:MAG: TA system VapC family ribonuclease toxin [Mycobacteriales bacterium]
MTTYLLDANVLIALTVEEHEHHDLVATWIRGVDRVALCPIVEGSLVRFLVRIGESVTVAAEVLRLLHANPNCEFWPDSVTYAEADLTGIHGHRQVTDAYLVALVASRPGATLATLDQALAQLRPNLTALIAKL